MTRPANRMQEAADRLMARFKSHAGVTISYVRGSLSIAGISATVGRTPYEVDDGGVLIAHESRDYLIEASDLVTADGDQWTPTSGDRIVEADGRVYEVSVPKPLNVYERIGPEATVFKVHTVGPK